METDDLKFSMPSEEELGDMIHDALEYATSESTILKDPKAKEICEMIDETIKGFEPFDLSKLGDSFKKDWFSPIWKRQKEDCTFHTLYRKLKGNLDLYDKEGIKAILEFSIGVYMDGASDQISRDNERIIRALRGRYLNKEDLNEHN